MREAYADTFPPGNERILVAITRIEMKRVFVRYQIGGTPRRRCSDHRVPELSRLILDRHALFSNRLP